MAKKKTGDDEVVCTGCGNRVPANEIEDGLCLVCQEELFKSEEEEDDD